MKSLAIRDFSMAKPAKPSVKIGYRVKDVELVDRDMNCVMLLGTKGPKIVSCFPSIDTGICEAQAKTIHAIATRKGIGLINVSADLPFAHGRWCMANELPGALLLSDFNGLRLGKQLGILIPFANLLYRCVFVLDEANKVIYMQFAKKVGAPLDFKALEAFLKKL